MRNRTSSRSSAVPSACVDIAEVSKDNPAAMSVRIGWEYGGGEEGLQAAG